MLSESLEGLRRFDVSHQRDKRSLLSQAAESWDASRKVSCLGKIVLTVLGRCCLLFAGSGMNTHGIQDILLMLAGRHMVNCDSHERTSVCLVFAVRNLLFSSSTQARAGICESASKVVLISCQIDHRSKEKISMAAP